MLNVTDLLTRAERAIEESVTITPAMGYSWLRSAMLEIGLAAGVLESVTLLLDADEWQALPSDFVREIELCESGRRYQGRWQIRAGRIKASYSGAYTLYYLRLPGPLTHIQNDIVNVLGLTAPGTLDTLIFFCNTYKAAHNAHLADTTVHLAADAVNVIIAADASDLATAITLLTEARTDFNAHRLRTQAHIYGDTRNAVSSPVPTTLASALTLAGELVEDFPRHLESGLPHVAFEECFVTYLAWRHKFNQEQNPPRQDKLYGQFVKALEQARRTYDPLPRSKGMAGGFVER